MSLLLVFDTTHHALWAEQTVLTAGCAAEIIPAPSAARAKCALALSCLIEEADRVFNALNERGVPYRRYEAAAPETRSGPAPPRAT